MKIQARTIGKNFIARVNLNMASFHSNMATRLFGSKSTITYGFCRIRILNLTYINHRFLQSTADNGITRQLPSSIVPDSLLNRHQHVNLVFTAIYYFFLDTLLHFFLQWKGNQGCILTPKFPISAARCLFISN